MRKDNFFKSAIRMHAVVFSIGLGLIAGIAATVVIKNTKSRKKDKLEKLLSTTQERRFDYLVYSPETYQINQDKRILDSLGEVNDNLFNESANKYFEKIDKKYPMGRFFGASDIAKINKILTPYVADVQDNSYLVSCMPLRANTSINEFEYVVRTVGIAPAKLMPMGVELDCGYIFRFQNQEKQKLFDSYIDEVELAFDENEKPNFGVREIAPIKTEYHANCAKIDSIQKSIAHNDLIRGEKLARFDRVIDSLQNELNKIKSK